MYEVTVTNAEEPYSGAIQQFLRAQFPASAARTPSDMLDDLTTAFVATGQVRYGPIPNPESLVAIRKILTKSIKAGSPIPVLMPWGSRKPDADDLLDVAEVCALKTIHCLHEKVKQIHPPGLDMRIRVEDLSGFYLFQDDGPRARGGSERYVRDFQILVRALGLDFIKPVLETVMMNEEVYFENAHRLEEMFFIFLLESHKTPAHLWRDLPSFAALVMEGWFGEIPPPMRAFYFSRYDSFYPGLPVEGKLRKLARYFGSVLARKQMRAMGDPVDWEGQFIKLTFHPPVPGVPLNLVETSLSYRTLPTRFAMTHIAPWRARGYLKVEDGEVLPKLASAREPLDLHDCRVRMTSGEDVVLVSTPYLL